MTELRKLDYKNLNQHPGNIENFVGYANVPTGIINKLVVNHKKYRSSVSIPLATTEGALVASYNRGSKAINLAGGVFSICVDEGIQRVPLFIFENVRDAVAFSNWILIVKDHFQSLVSKKSNYAKLKQVYPIIEGNSVNLELTFSTGDAAGQNMITFCSKKICQFIAEHSPITIKKWYIEGNLAGDKKSSAQYMKTVRGRRVIADVVIPRSVVQSVLKSTPENIYEYWKRSLINQSMSHSIGSHGHLANGLAAIFLATGQDVACVSESTAAISRFELTENNDLYACITLSSLIVGTVGGGTSMPYAKANLELMDCQGQGNAIKFAEIVAGVLLAGELSVAAAICEKHFTAAHMNLGR